MFAGETNRNDNLGQPDPQTVKARCQQIQESWNSKERAVRRLQAWGIEVPENVDLLLDWFKTSQSQTGDHNGSYVI